MISSIEPIPERCMHATQAAQLGGVELCLIGPAGQRSSIHRLLDLIGGPLLCGHPYPCANKLLVMQKVVCPLDAQKFRDPQHGRPKIEHQLLVVD